MIITKIAEDRTNSYEIIALVDLKDPKNAYLAPFLILFY